MTHLFRGKDESRKVSLQSSIGIDSLNKNDYIEHYGDYNYGYIIDNE